MQTPAPDTVREFFLYFRTGEVFLHEVDVLHLEEFAV